MLWNLGWMLQFQGNGWVSLPSEEGYTLGCLLKTQVVFFKLCQLHILDYGWWECTKVQVDSFPLWVAAGLRAHPENHSSLDHITWGGSGRRLVGLGLWW